MFLIRKSSDKNKRKERTGEIKGGKRRVWGWGKGEDRKGRENDLSKQIHIFHCF